MKQNGLIQKQKVTEVKVSISRELRNNMTVAESIFWDMVRDKKLLNLKFRRQQIIDGYIVDFYCNKINLIVEIDGSIHDTIENTKNDLKRTSVLERRGLQVLRFLNNEILVTTQLFSFENPNISVYRS